jgi:hypothetical protein
MQHTSRPWFLRRGAQASWAPSSWWPERPRIGGSCTTTAARHKRSLPKRGLAAWGRRVAQGFLVHPHARFDRKLNDSGRVARRPLAGSAPAGPQTGTATLPSLPRSAVSKTAVCPANFALFPFFPRSSYGALSLPLWWVISAANCDRPRCQWRTVLYEDVIIPPWTLETAPRQAAVPPPSTTHPRRRSPTLRRPVLHLGLPCHCRRPRARPPHHHLSGLWKSKHRHKH